MDKQLTASEALRERLIAFSQRHDHPPELIEQALRLLGNSGLPGGVAGGVASGLTGAIKWLHPPVGIRQFIEDPNFLGNAGEVYPAIMEVLEELASGKYVEAVLTGAIGTGKTSIALWVTAHSLYQLSCMRDPHGEFDLARSSEITIIFQSITRELAKGVDYQRFRAMIERAPYFQRHFPFDKSIESELRFPNRIIVKPVSGSETAAIGQNVIGGCFPPGQKFLLATGTMATMASMLGRRITTLTINELNQVVPSDETQVVITGKKQLVRLHLENGDTVNCTPDQKFRGENNEWINASDSAGRLLRFTPVQDVRGQGSLSVEFIRCVGVEDITTEPVTVYDVENVGGTHVFFAATQTGFVHAKNCIDEMNYMAIIEKSRVAVDKGTYDQAITVYNSIARRRKSRFMKKGKLPGILCLVSSKRYPGQFTDQKEKEARSDPTIYVYDKRTWDIKPWAFSGRFFRVFVGDEARNPRILSEGEQVGDGQVMDIPVEYLREFETDIMNALRDIAGVSTQTLRPFLVNREAVVACFGKHDSILDRNDVAWPVETLNVLIDDFHEPERKRWAHVDLSRTSDSTGIVMGYVNGFTQMDRGEDIEILPQIKIDFALEVRPPKGGEISFEKIRTLFYILRDQGVNLKWISFDSYQSADSIQILRQKGFMTNTISMDKNTPAYDMLKTALYDKRVAMPAHPKLMHELLSLEFDTKKGKVDHPPLGSKDLSDALAGVVFGLSTRREIWWEFGIPPDQIPESLYVQASKANEAAKAHRGFDERPSTE